MRRRTIYVLERYEIKPAIGEFGFGPKDNIPRFVIAESRESLETKIWANTPGQCLVRFADHVLGRMESLVEDLEALEEWFDRVKSAYEQKWQS